MNYYDMNTQEVLSQLDTSMNGLTGGEAESRLSRYGKNEITEQKKKGGKDKFAKRGKGGIGGNKYLKDSKNKHCKRKKKQRNK